MPSMLQDFEDSEEQAHRNEMLARMAGAAGRHAPTEGGEDSAERGSLALRGLSRMAGLVGREDAPLPPARPDPLYNLNPGLAGTARSLGQAGSAFAREAPGAALAVGQDLVSGAVETPGAIYAGGASAINEVIDLTYEAGEAGARFMEKHAGPLGQVDPRLTFTDPETGGFKLGFLWRRDEVRAFQEAVEAAGREIQPQLPGGPEQDTVSGNAVRGISQFLVGWVGGGQAFKSLRFAKDGGRVLNVGRGMVRGFLADAAVFDGHEARLSDLIQEVPALQNPVTEFLESTEEDSEAVGRLKNGLEGLGIGALVDPLVAGIRAVRGGRRGREAAERVVQTEDALDESAAAEIQRDIIEVGGSPNAAPVQVMQEPRRMEVGVWARLDEMGRGEGEIGAEEAEALIGAARRWADEVRRQQPEVARGIDDIEAEWRERGDPEVARRLTEAMNAAREELPRPVGLVDWLAARGGLVDEGGELASRDLDSRQSLLERFNSDAGKQELDDATEAAWEAGYLGPRDSARPTPRELLDAIDQDIRARSNQDEMARIFSDADDDIVQAHRSQEQLRRDLEEAELNYGDRSAARRADAALDAAPAQRGDTATEADIISIEQAMEAAGARYGVSMPAAEARGAHEVRINFNALNTSDDVRSVIGQLADAYKGEIDEARGPRRSHAELFDEQSEIGRAWDVLEQRGPRGVLNDAEVVAAQRLYVASGESVRRMAQRALDNPGGEMAQFALRRAMAVHRSIQAEIAGAKAEAGRALRAWAVVTGSDASARSQMANIMNSFGGPLSQRDLARLAVAGAEELDNVARHMSRRERISAVGADVLRFMFLSGPHTHIMNMAGNTLTTVYDTMPRLMAGVKGSILGDAELERQLGAALAQYSGLGAGLRAQFRAFTRSADYEQMGRRIGEAVGSVGRGQRSMRQALMESASAVWEDNPLAATARGRFDDMGVAGRKFDDGAGSGARNVSGEAMGVESGGVLDALEAGDFTGAAKNAAGNLLDGTGRLLSAPTDFLGFQDDFFKGVNEVSERHALAYEQAARELDSGTISREQFQERYRHYIENPTREIKGAARDAAQRRTFTGPTGRATGALMTLRRQINNVTGIPFGHILLPFLSTPSNILSFAFQSSPVGFAFKSIRDDLAAGGIRRAQAQARMATGTSMLFVGMDMAANGQITGAAPSDPGEREEWERAGIQEYSIGGDGMWVSYRRLEPVSTMLAIGADMATIAANVAGDDTADVDTAEVLGVALGAALNAVTSKTYLTGFAEAVKFTEDPQRYGPSYLERTLSSLMVPAGIGQIERIIDPEIRAAHNIVTQAMARIPGLSEDLPVQHDLWGRPRTTQSGVSRTYDALSPFTIRVSDPEPIDRELYRIGHYPRRPQPRLTVPYMGQGVEVNLRNAPHLYQQYVRLAGGEVRGAHGMTALQFMNAVVERRVPESETYYSLSDAPGAEGTKAQFIDRALGRYRQEAFRELYRENRSELEGMARDVLRAQERAYQAGQEERSLLPE